MSRSQRRNRRSKSGSSSQSALRNRRDSTDDRSADRAGPRSSTETKSSLKTTELIVYAGAVLAVVMAALAIDEGDRGGADPFGAESAIRYITYLTIGYMVARGLAKSGSHEQRVERPVDVDDVGTGGTGGTHDDEATEAVDDERHGDVDLVKTAAAPSDDVERAQARTVDARN